MPHSSCKGHTIVEFSLLLAFLGMLAIGSYALLGHSIQEALGLATNPGAQLPADLLNTQPNEKLSVTGNGLQGLNSMLPANSSTGASPLSIQLNGLSPISVNVSSVDGNSETMLGTYRLAAYLDQLASQQTDPNNQAYFAQMAQLAYYMGANESELDDYSVFVTTSHLNNAEALNDLLSKQAQLEALINNPPASLKPKDLLVATPLVNQVNAIAQNYHDHLSGVLNSSGKAITDFMLFPKDSTKFGAYGIGSSVEPGVKAALMTDTQVQSGRTYESVMSYDQLKTNVASLLKGNPVLTDVPVITTYSNAQTVDKQGNTN